MPELPDDSPPPEGALPPEPTMEVETTPLSTLGRLARESSRDYEAEDEIARGGMGSIFKVRDEALHRNLAMKLMHGERGLLDPAQVDGGRDYPPPGRMMKRFLQEAQIMGQLDHPGVVPVHELGLNREGRLFFTMKLVRGRTLTEVIDLVHGAEDRWTMTRAVQVFIRLCETLAFAHTKNVIHRDLKPDNVMTGRFGEVYLMDWGLAKVVKRPTPATARESLLGVVLSEQEESIEDPLTEQGDILGTPMYMPPEQVLPGLGSQGIPGDIYSVGAMLYHLLAGAPPYLAQDPGCRGIEILEAIRAGPPKPLSEIAPKAPVELTAIAAKAMAREPADRYATAAELAEDLHRFLEGRVVRAHRTGPLRELRKWVQRNMGLAASLVITMMLLIGGTLGIAIRERKSARDIGREASRAQEAEIRAVTALGHAERERQRAHGRLLSSRALTEASTRPALALHLAIRGAELAPGREANDALYLALSGHHETLRLTGPEGHAKDPVRSGDGRWVLTRSGKTATLWDLVNGLARAVLSGHGAALTGHAFSPDSARILTTSLDRTARVWDRRTGKHLLTLAGHSGEVGPGSFSPDGSRIVTPSADGTARIWDAETGEQLRELADHQGGCIGVDWSPDGRLLVTVDGAGVGRVRDADSGSLLHRMMVSVERPDPKTIRFVLGGAAIFTHCVGGPARVYDAATGEVRHEFAPSRYCAISGDGKRVLLREPSAGDPNTGRVFDLATGEAIGHPFTAQSFVPCALDLFGQRVAAGGREGPYQVEIFDIESGGTLGVLRGHEYSVFGTEFLRHGQSLVTAAGDRTVRFWSSNPFGESVARVPPEGWVPGPRGFLAAGLGRGSKQLEVVAVVTGAIRYRLRLPEAGRPEAVSFDREGARIHVALPSALLVLDALTGEEVGALRTPAWRDLSAGHGAVVPSPDGQRVAVATAEGIAIFDLADGERIGELLAPGPAGTSLSFSPDGGRILVAAGRERTASLWDIKTGEEVTRFTGHTGDVLGAAFHPGGKFVATSAMDHTIRLWNAESGEPVAVIPGFPMEQIDLAFHPDGSVLAARTAAGVYLLDGETGEIRSRISANGGEFARAWFSRDDPDSILTLTTEGGVRRWPLAPLGAATLALPSELTPELREQFDLE